MAATIPDPVTRLNFLGADFIISVPAVAKFLVAFSIAQFLQVSSIVWAMIGLMVIDFVTGVGVAFINGEVSSEIGSRGAVKKLMMILLVVGLHIVEGQAGIQFKAGDIEFHVEHFACVVLSFNELISIVENCARAGLRLPEFLVLGLIRLKKVKLQSASREQLDELRGDKRHERGPKTPVG